MNDQFIPFGMLLEEDAPAPCPSEPTPHYDVVDQVSYIILGRNQRVPYVVGAWAISGAGTKTFTQVKAEPTDSDPTPFPTTSTETHVRAETSDSDWR